MKFPKYGETVIITRIFKRVIIGTSRKWEEVEFKAAGIFLGLRNLSNGTTYNTRNFGKTVDYQAAEIFPAALVSPGEDRNPVYVPIASLEE